MKFLLVLAVIAVAVFVLYKRQANDGASNKKRASSRRKLASSAASEQNTNFHTTTIEPGRQSCQAVQTLQGKVFLDSEHHTPNLPLPECTQASDCHCTYQHQEDRRRADEDRRDPHKLETEIYHSTEGNERRGKKRGRRSTD
jgi:hypothetical protein